jgi:AcrR family transcriptional regulator
MPKTRTKAEHQEKANEIVNAAISQLRSGGIDALSVAALARKLGVAQNTIYWYFPSRDHVLVAAMGRMAERVINEGADLEGMPLDSAQKRTSRDAILSAVDRFAEVQPLRIAMRERAGSSPIVREFDERLTAFIREALREAFTPFVPEAEMALAIDTFTLASDGCYVRGLGPEERRSVLGFVLDRLGVRE